MPGPHVIRLNRVWELRVSKELPPDDSAFDEAIAETPLRERIDLPWTSNQIESAPLLLSRRFNRPSNLKPGQSIHLSVQPAAIAARVQFNGRPLDAPTGQTVAGAPLLLAIGGRMRDHNRLHIIGPPPESLAQANILLIIDDFLDT